MLGNALVPQWAGDFAGDVFGGPGLQPRSNTLLQIGNGNRTVDVAEGGLRHLL
jgi:hypothetical protein